MTDRRPNWKFFCPKTPYGHFHGLLEALTCSSVLISRTILLLTPPILRPIPRKLNDIDKGKVAYIHDIKKTIITIID